MDCWIPTRFVFGIRAAGGVLGTLATFNEHTHVSSPIRVVGRIAHHPIAYGLAFLDALYIGLVHLRNAPC
jgi:hypothetical protein